MDDSSLPGCIGYYEAPLPPNECSRCPYVKTCRKMRSDFVPKAKLHTVLERLERLEVKIRGVCPA